MLRQMRNQFFRDFYQKCFETGFHSKLFLVFLLGKLEFEHSCITGKNSAAAVTVLLRERLLLRLFSDILSICNEVEGAFFTPPMATEEATKTKKPFFQSFLSMRTRKKYGRSEQTIQLGFWFSDTSLVRRRKRRLGYSNS